MRKQYCVVRSDRGSHFANELIKDFLDLTGTPSIYLSPARVKNSDFAYFL